MLAAAGAEGEAAAAFAANAPVGHDPLEVEGRTLELRRMGPRDFFGEIAILNEAVGGRSLISVVSVTDMRLLAIHLVDFKNTADAAMEV
jgi:CRP-like cAMP-binding protein